MKYDWCKKCKSSEGDERQAYLENSLTLWRVVEKVLNSSRTSIVTLNQFRCRVVSRMYNIAQVGGISHLWIGWDLPSNWQEYFKPYSLNGAFQSQAVWLNILPEVKGILPRCPLLQMVKTFLPSFCCRDDRIKNNMSCVNQAFDCVLGIRGVSFFWTITMLLHFCDFVVHFSWWEERTGLNKQLNCQNNLVEDRRKSGK